MRNLFWSWNFLKDLDAKSAIQLCSPEMCSVVIGDAWHVSMHSARMRISRAAHIAFVARSLVAHVTVGVLSHQQATWACRRSAKRSSTNHWSSSPTISRSEFVIFPRGFCCETTSCWMCCGNSTRHTNGGNFLASPYQTPPAPCLEASQ